jgi:DNA-binding NtrC family response regulator
LREREEDIVIIARHFMSRFAKDMKRSVPELGPGVESLLRSHPWPGNVRELRNAVERALILCDGDQVHAEHFDLDPGPGAERSPETSPRAGTAENEGRARDPWPPLRDVSRRAAEDAEVQLIRRALEASKGNRMQAARLLGVSVRTLWTKLRAMEEAGEPVDEKDIATAVEFPPAT